MLHVKDKERLLNAERQEKTNLLYTKELPKDYQQIFSAETLQAKKEWNNVLKLLEEKKKRKERKKEKNPANQKCSTWQSYLSELNRE